MSTKSRCFHRGIRDSTDSALTVTDDAPGQTNEGYGYLTVYAPGRSPASAVALLGAGCGSTRWAERSCERLMACDCEGATLWQS